MIISINMGNSGPLGTSVLTHWPIHMTVKQLRHFSDEIRAPLFIELLHKIADENYVSRVTMVLWITVDNKKWFKIHMRNVREYRATLKKSVLKWYDEQDSKKREGAPTASSGEIGQDHFA